MQPPRGKWIGPLVGALTGVLIVAVAALGVTSAGGGSDAGTATTTTRTATTDNQGGGTAPDRGGTRGDDRDAEHAERHEQMEKHRGAMDACLTERGVDVPERPERGTRPDVPPSELDEPTRAAIEACHEELDAQGLAPGGHRGERGGHGPMRGGHGPGPGHRGPGGDGGGGAPGDMGGMQG